MLGSIDFAKRIIGSARTVSEQTMPAVATSDSVDGIVTMAVGKPLEDQDGNLVPEFDEDGNELGDLGNVTEAETVGNVKKGDAVVFGNGFVTGAIGGGDDAASGATDYIVDDDGGVLFTYPGSLTSIRLGETDLRLVQNETMTPIASMSIEGFSLYDGEGEKATSFDLDGIRASSGQVLFQNGVDIWPNDGEKMGVHGPASFDGSVDMPGKIQAGTEPVATVAANGVREIPVTFEEPFSAAPAVIVSLESPQTQLIGNCAAYVHNRTSAGFTLRIINNNDGNTRDLGASWVAIAK